MNKRVTGLIVASAAACLPLGIAMADLQSETRADVTQICKKAIGKEGYKGYRYDNVEFNEARSGYSLTGQISKGSKRYEFNCVVSTRMSVTDLAVNPLSGGDDRGGPRSQPLPDAPDRPARPIRAGPRPLRNKAST